MVLALVPAGMPVIPVIGILFLATAAQGFVIGNVTGLGVGHARACAGTASALLGALPFSFAALVTPVVGLGYQPRTLGVVMLACGVVALLPVIRAPGGRRSGADTGAGRVADA